MYFEFIDHIHYYPTDPDYFKHKDEAEQAVREAEQTEKLTDERA